MKNAIKGKIVCLCARAIGHKAIRVNLVPALFRRLKKKKKTRMTRLLFEVINIQYEHKYESSPICCLVLVAG